MSAKRAPQGTLAGTKSPAPVSPSNGRAGTEDSHQPLRLGSAWPRPHGRRLPWWCCPSRLPRRGGQRGCRLASSPRQAATPEDGGALVTGPELPNDRPWIGSTDRSGRGHVPTLWPGDRVVHSLLVWVQRASLGLLRTNRPPKAGRRGSSRRGSGVLGLRHGGVPGSTHPSALSAPATRLAGSLAGQVLAPS